MNSEEIVNSMKNNVAIVGLPRSGKTTKSKQLFEEFPEENQAIFINSQWEDYFTGHEILKRMTDYDINKSKIVFNFDENEDLIILINKLFQIQKASVVPKPIRLIIDEVYMFQEYDNAKKTLTKLVVDGLKWQIQTIITAHFPQMVHSSIYKNVHLFYFFKMNNALYDYFKKTWRINLWQYQTYLAKENQYNYVFYDGADFHRKSDKTLDNVKIKTPTASKTISEVLRDFK